MRPALLLLALTLCACFERSYDCDQQEIVSVAVTLESSGGLALEHISVRYTSPGAQQARACDRSGSAWLCGSDDAGHILIEASADCHGEVSETVVVSEGLCHVEQQDLHLLMDPVDCTQEEVPGVFVTVADQDGVAVPDASVGFVPGDQDWTDYEACEPYNEGWACAWGWSGAIDLEVIAEGFSPWTDRVIVEDGCCGPETEQVDVVLLLGG